MAVLEQIVFFLIILVLIKIYAVYTKGICTCKDRLDGKTVLLTGGNSGIGFQTALNLARRGARIIITSENENDIHCARNDIIKLTNNNQIIAKHLDLRSLQGIRSFVKDIYETEQKLDILINNAGTSGAFETYTKDGLISDLQVNYFGPFLLTNLLINLLRKGAGARIVNVCSVGAHFGILNLKDINKSTLPFMKQFNIYCNSKLFVLHMTWELADKLRGSGITVNCLHPGCVNTPLLKKIKILFLKVMFVLFGKLYFKSEEEGAQTSIHLAISEKVGNTTGHYFQDCRICLPFIKKDRDITKAVWDQSLELVKLKTEEMQI